MGQETIDAAVQKYYGELFDERLRLTSRSAQGRLEFERTQEVVRAATPAPARILDVGGGAGVHAAALAADGYEVVLVDPVPRHVAAAARHGTFVAELGDARRLRFEDDSFDAVLMAGPLYHLSERAERARALNEARRVCRPGGAVHAAAIPRLAAFAGAALSPAVLDANTQGWLDLLRHGTPAPVGRFPGGHFHSAEELQRELEDAGLHDVTVVGIEGPAGLAFETRERTSEADIAAALRLARLFAADPGIREFSNHLLGSGTP
ncbi:class I SAM-dependent methyltransferase [Microbacterium sp. NPDC055903]